MITCMHPVYVDGPLRGQDFAVDGRSVSVQAIDYDENTLTVSVVVSSRMVNYRLRQYGIFGRIIWVGSLADEPRLEDLADLLLSPAAKTAGRQVLPDLPGRCKTCGYDGTERAYEDQGDGTWLCQACPPEPGTPAPTRTED